MIDIKNNKTCEKILEYICRGDSNNQIANAMGYATSTITYYIHELLTAYNARNRAHLACMFLAGKLKNYQKHKELLEF